MAIDPNVIRAEAHTEIGLHLIQGIGIVLERWSRRAVEEQPNAMRVHHAVLLDHLHDFLYRLGHTLAESANSETCEHHAPAVVHGEQRWEAGWLLSEVVRDYQIPRLVILDYLEEVLDRPLRCQEMAAVGLALDEAISASVIAYVKERDEYLRSLAEERAAQDKQIQEQLRSQAEALKEADRCKNRFIAMLAHELRNPLASISTAVEIQRLKGFTDPDLARSQDVIERQVRQMTRLVDDLLDVSRVTEGKLKLHKEPLEVATVVNSAVEMARPFIDARKHKLKVALPLEPVWLEADLGRLIQVLCNLLHNAAEYTEEGGQIELTAQQQDGKLVIKICDTGIGISSDLLPRVFEPFTQDERSVDRSDGGLGIGLALVKSLVELHGGTVQAFSSGRGHGSEFAVTLPAPREAPPRQERKLDRPSESVSVRRILVVDDNKDAAKTLALLLRIEGHEVREAYDGPAAMDVALDWLPDVVLLDIGLPKLNGYEVARRLRIEPRLRTSRIIALSGYREEVAQGPEDLAFDAYLIKPVEVSALARVIAPENEMPRQRG